MVEPGLGFGLVGEDEPVFVVRGCDVAAPATIEAWARLARLHGAQPGLVARAESWAARVRSWQQQHGARVPGVQDGSSG